MQQVARARRGLVGALAAAGTLLVGCGSDGTTTGAPTSGGASAHAGAGVAGACTALTKLDAIPTPEGGPETGPSSDDIKQFGQAVLPLLNEAREKGGPELAADLDVLLPIAKDAAEQGTPIPEEDEKLQGALNGYHTWAHQKCGYQNVDVTAVDYKFEGIPAKVKAGPTSIALANHSEKGEFHVALLVQPKDAKITTVEQLLAVPMAQLESSVDVVGSAAAPPHAGGGLLIDLKPGRYFVVCPVSVGGDDQSQDLHMMHGMATMFEVA